MTEDQIREIANLSASMAHVTKAVDDIKTRVDKMPTREELREFVTHQELTSLAGRLEAVERRVVEGSLQSAMARARDIALTVTAVAAAIGVIAHLMGYTR
jgi:predicted house-cleaning noncanonical NTP pyrophosphatase (MazG superfamily)